MPVHANEEFFYSVKSLRVCDYEEQNTNST